ncbi:hypothetical protein [Niallia sp. FSL M8-0099]|uniref:hypothetical protein n=1 Tax=Niallia sp. FSL M8-0099 TaxID=2954519 RepID=UPI0030F58BAA
MSFNIKITTKQGRVYQIGNVTEPNFREFIGKLKPDGFAIFNDIAIFANEIEAIEKF